MGADARGDRDHLGGRRHLEVERREELALQPLHIVVADMPAVLAQVRGDAVGPGEHGEMGGADRVRMAAAARIPQVATWSMLTPRRIGGAFMSCF